MVLVDGDVGFISSVERLGLLVWYIYEYNNWKACREIIHIMRYMMILLYTKTKPPHKSLEKLTAIVRRPTLLVGNHDDVVAVDSYSKSSTSSSSARSRIDGRLMLIASMELFMMISFFNGSTTTPALFMSLLGIFCGSLLLS